jgi:serine/threonine protein kinase
MNEKRVMLMLQHPFIIRLFATFRDKNRLMFLLEPILGGELFTVLRARTLFDEDTSRFFAASVVLAFEFMHDKNIIYRDLKPENLLLDHEGYLKVTDFGFAKELSGRTWTLCGTPDYLAPEIVAGKGHGKGVDWWTLGVFIYEMLASYPPFYDEDPMKTYAKIIHGTITFPSHFSKDAINLIQKLLHHKPTKRLGVVAGGAKLIKKHPWFKGFDWDALYARKLKAYIIPKIKSTEDLSNFDDYGEKEHRTDPYDDDGSNWDAEFAS